MKRAIAALLIAVPLTFAAQTAAPAPANTAPAAKTTKVAKVKKVKKVKTHKTAKHIVNSTAKKA